MRSIPSPHRHTTRRSAGRRDQAGFSLIELLLAMIVAVEILVVAAMAFDISNKTAAVQTQITDLQQSLRIAQLDVARLVRSAGRGGLPVAANPGVAYVPPPPIPELQGYAIEVRNNVPDADRHISREDDTSPEALEGTDILTVRGCISSPLYQITPDTMTIDAGTGTGTLPVPNISVASIRQPLRPICDELIENGNRGTLILSSPESRQVYGIVNVTGHNCPATGQPTSIDLQIATNTNSPLNPMDPIAGVRRFPPAMDAATACLLEEYRYYVADVHEDPADPDSPLRPHLARARFQPGTELPHLDDPTNYALPISDGVFDLQVALGFDSNYPSSNPSNIPGAFEDDDDFDNDSNDEVIFEAADVDSRDTDDWLYNHPDDDPTDTQYRTHQFAGRIGQPVALYHVRITTVARTLRADRTYQAPDFDPDPSRDFVEDHDYDDAPASDFKSVENRKFRRRSLTTIIDMRNTQ